MLLFSIIRLILLTFALCQATEIPEIRLRAVDTVTSRVESLNISWFQKTFVKLFAIASVKDEGNSTNLLETYQSMKDTLFKMVLLSGKTHTKKVIVDLVDTANEVHDKAIDVMSSLHSDPNLSSIEMSLLARPISSYTRRFIEFQHWQLVKMYQNLLHDPNTPINWWYVSQLFAVVERSLYANEVSVEMFHSNSYRVVSEILRIAKYLLNTGNSFEQYKVPDETSVKFEIMEDPKKKPNQDQYLLYIRKMMFFMSQGIAIVFFCVAANSIPCIFAFGSLISMSFVIWIFVMIQYMAEFNNRVPTPRPI
ncbi:hypothetical protein Kpol_1045p81 [Vanderwaltozyma polyspora DSM 70294]|uniref:Uncharacterized protein n=1 Tax=Vanderwaltozyma polyspora (strain ATCC 22028 / DSM 70294 / BCRC 21397 / CBS 2163 / NBRC 10782 / NRRL Y-8283 / UCD 57-17) TaxID=436907 RepID=A7TI87_VANPO|nr:uncharacterized protein Kpol_1045p81 [Vanderwaltozyma polyspora DSM 70294]EDO18094.1 hypothetical protein Kpol_1045p81 [Vanderwaltozyma polyspora DSM 70294]